MTVNTYADFLQVSGTNIRIKPVAKPCAQIAKLCSTDSKKMFDVAILGRQSAVVRKIDERCFVVLTILMNTGCRISECLNISPYDITVSGAFYIKGLKGSESRLYKLPEVANYMVNCKRLGVYPFEGLSRFYVYRVFKKCGIGYRFEGNKHASVTHLPRHVMAIDAKSIEGGNNYVTDVLRHKSEKNRAYYDKEK